MTTIINASPSNGLVQTADGSGILKVQSDGKTTNALAWVNFAGASGSINSAYNVSSVTRSGTGLYQINFTNAMTNASYTFAAGLNRGSGGVGIVVANDSIAYSTTALGLRITDLGVVAIDPTSTSIVIFGN